jgi:putative endonuclease
MFDEAARGRRQSGVRRSGGTFRSMTPRIRALLNRLLGDRGERLAARFLRRQGMRVLLRGYRTSYGEIDLIARHADTLVFVEVRARRHGEPAETITPDKERRLTLAALHFLKKHNLLETRSRFDIVAVVWPNDRHPPRIEHIRGAFDAVGRGQMFR